jgi:hypothetical protein
LQILLVDLEQVVQHKVLIEFFLLVCLALQPVLDILEAGELCIRG